MNLFIDSSAIYAYINGLDSGHQRIVPIFERALDQESLFTSNYVALESNSLVQRRLGMRALRVLERDVLPQMKTIWIDNAIHEAALGMVLTANRRQLSLVDCTSFEIMRREQIRTVVTLDKHFAEQGFEIWPTPDD